MNRKIISALLALTLLTLTGCTTNEGTTTDTITAMETLGTTAKAEEDTKNNTVDQQINETTENTEQSTNHNETNESDENVLNDDSEFEADEEMLNTFLSSLQNGTGSEEIGATYDFLDNITIDSYTYIRAENNDEYGTAFDVTLDVSESNTDVIPVGESDWRIVIFPDAGGYVRMFCPIQKRNIVEDSVSSLYLTSQDNSAIAYRMAVNFSRITNVYSADSAWFESYTQPGIHKFYHSLPYEQENEADSPQDIADKLKKYFNINTNADAVSETFTNVIDENGNIIWGSCGHGDTFVFTTADSIKEGTNGIAVEVTFYADTAYFYPAVTADYEFKYNDDNTLRLDSVNLVKDYGYEPAVGSV